MVPSSQSERTRVLLVEDNEFVAEGIRFAMAFYGFDVQVIGDVSGAIGWMTTDTPEVVVVDLSLQDLEESLWPRSRGETGRKCLSSSSAGLRSR